MHVPNCARRKRFLSLPASTHRRSNIDGKMSVDEVCGIYSCGGPNTGFWGAAEQNFGTAPAQLWSVGRLSNLRLTSGLDENHAGIG